MNEIPNDVMEVARAVADEAHDDMSHRGTVAAVSKAILAERSRAASTARSWAHTCRKVGQSEGADVAEDIAKCIEEGK